MTTLESFDVYPATALSDTEQLRETLESAIQNPITHVVVGSEVEEVLQAVNKARQAESERYYAVAIASGDKVLGMMGLQIPGAAMLEYATSDKPAELINAYVLASSRGAGVGRSLLCHLEAKAAECGHTELIVNSGVRYKWSGWPFWSRLYGDPAGIAKNYYGPELDAMVWRKSLTDPC